MMKYLLKNGRLSYIIQKFHEIFNLFTPVQDKFLFRTYVVLK